MAMAVLTASVVVPTPPFGAEEDDDATTRPGPCRRRRHLASRPVGAACTSSASTLASSSVPSKELGDDVIGARLDEPDALLDVVTLGDAEDRPLALFGRLAEPGHDAIGRAGVGHVDHHQRVVAWPA